jgi:dihydroflavonol-4-reductase
MRAAVVGGSGFLGLNIIAALKETGHEVIATRRRSSNTIFLRRLKVPMVQAAMENPDELVAAMTGVEVVFFASGLYPRYSVDCEQQVHTAVRCARNLLAAAKAAGVRRIIYTGSVATVRRPGEDRPAKESDGAAPTPEQSPYFATKRALEDQMLRATQTGQDVVLLLPTGCFGPYDHKVGTGHFIVSMASHRLEVFTEGRINVVDARDVAAAHVRAAEVGDKGERYILGGHNLTVSGLLTTMSRLYGVPLPKRPLTHEQALSFAQEEEARCLQTHEGRPALSREMVEMIVYGQWVDSQKARDRLGFHPRPLEQTLVDAFQWYCQNGYIRRDMIGRQVYGQQSATE